MCRQEVGQDMFLVFFFLIRVVEGVRPMLPNAHILSGCVEGVWPMLPNVLTSYLDLIQTKETKDTLMNCNAISNAKFGELNFTREIDVYIENFNDL